MKEHKDFVILAFFVMLLTQTSCSVCTGSTSDNNKIVTTKDTLTPSTATIIFGVCSSSVSKSIYYMYDVMSSPQSTAIRKYNSDNTFAWMSVVGIRPVIKSVNVDKNDQLVCYVGNTTPAIGACHQTSNGNLVSAKQIANTKAASNDVRIFPLSDATGYYLVAEKNGFSYGILCKYIFSVSGSAQCQDITTMKTQGYGPSLLNDSQLFLFSVNPSSPYNMNFYKVTFGNTAVDFASKMACTGGVCSTSYSDSIVSVDGLKIYCTFAYGSTSYLYFITFNSADLSVTDTRYKSTSNCGGTWTAALSSNYLGFLGGCSGQTIFLFNLNTNEYTAYKANFSTIYGVTNDPSTDRFVVVGDNNSRGYISKFYAESIGFHSDFTQNTVALSALASGQETITSVLASISSPTSQTASACTCSIIPLTYNLNPSNEYISDVYFQVSVQSLSMNENTILNITPDLSCSVSGSNPLSFSIASYNGETIPSFVSIDVTSGLLTISSPEIASDTVYHFYVNTLNSTATFPAHKLIELTVKNVVVTTSTSATPSSTPPQQSCLVSNCKSCISTSNYICNECNSEYGLQSGSCYILCCSSTTTSCPSKHISNCTTTSASVIAGTTTNSVVGATACIAVGSSLMNAASFSSLWSMVNQLQLFFLLLIANIYLPDGVTATITQSNFFVFPFNFFKIKHIGSIDLGIDNFDIELNNANIEYFGINSESTLFNIYPFLVSLLVIIGLHAIVYCIRKYVLICKIDGRCSKLISVMKYIFDRLYFVLTYGYYIRTLLEINQYMLVSSLNELYHYDVSSGIKLVSIIIAFTTLILCVLLLICVLGLSLSSYEQEENQHNKLGELFEGVKNGRYKLYAFVLLLRRFIFISMLITLSSKCPIIVLYVLCGLQIVYLLFIFLFRPFEETKQNTIEILNEIFFSFLLCWLIWHNTESDWGTSSTTIYIYIITSNTILIFIILIIDLIKTGISKLYQRCYKSPANRVKPLDTKNASQLETQIKEYNFCNALSKSEVNKSIQSSNINIKEENKYRADESMPEIQIFQIKVVNPSNQKQSKMRRF